jgi:lipid-binding SYLF domain-containing protein
MILEPVEATPMTPNFLRLISCALALFLALSGPAAAESAAKIDRDARRALGKLTAKVPAAKALQAKAVAVLVFPSITKAGLMIGGQYGEGALMKGGKTLAYYSTGGASYGLQAGAQQYGYVLFFMKEGALRELDKASGFEVGVGPSIVVVDEGMGKSSTTTTMTEDIYAFIFSQKGLMAGLGIQGNKISKIQPK